MQERLIRKYSNRRLYDTTASRHVTLEDLRQIIVSGDRIKVVDDKSGEDLTRAVLLQIIAEQEQFGVPVLGSELLEMIIRFYGSPMQGLLTRYLGEAFGSILRQQEAMHSEMAKALQAPFAPLAELARQNMELWQSATRAAFTGDAPPSSRADSDASRDGGAGPSGPGERPGGAHRAGSSPKKRNKARDKGK